MVNVFQIKLSKYIKIWRNLINEKMKKITESFELYGDDPRKIICYQEITTHLIFDGNLSKNFRRKSRLVGDRYKTNTSYFITYLSVLSRDSVLIHLMIES